MLILADIRCLQDPDYAGRGVGSHAAFLLRAIRLQGGAGLSIIGLTDPDIGPLAAEHVALCDSVRPTFRVAFGEQPAVFLQLSPMTHDTRQPAAVLDQPGITAVTVIYDFIPLEFSERYLANREQLYGYAAAFRWLTAYKRFLPISAYAAAETSRRLGISDDRMKVTGVALRPAFEVRMGQSGSETPEPTDTPPHILFIGGGDPRKNLDAVATAFEALASRGHRAVLEIVGNYPRKVRRKLLAQSSARGSLLFHDRLSDEQLAERYTKAAVTVVASRAEGFSMPVIEAIACGCPVIASDIAAHRELITDAQALFNPNDVAGLTGLLEQMLASKTARKALRDSQQPVAERFTAAAVGSLAWQAMSEAKAKGPTPTLHSRPRLAFVTPFPPDRSGVADYSRQTVIALGQLTEIDVYTDQPDPIVTPGVRRFYPISAAAWLRPDYDAVVSVIGNSHFHTKIFRWHCRYGGACIVHDNRLLDLLMFWRGLDHVRQLASRSLDREVSGAEINNWVADPANLPLMFFDELLPKADPLIVHSRGIQAHLERLTGHQAEYLPFCVYRDLQQDRTAGPTPQPRADLGIAADQLVIASFGSVADVKRPDVCIAAVGELRHKGINAHLYFVGSAASDQRSNLARQAAAAGAGEAVHFTGDWTDEDVYRKFLAAADLGIQLRGHFFGGLSGALLDCIAAGLPTVANRDLAEAVETPDFVARVSDQPTGSEVAEALNQLLTINRDDPRHTAARDRYMAEHSFEQYAEGLLNLLLGAQRARIADPARSTTHLCKN